MVSGEALGSLAVIKQETSEFYKFSNLSKDESQSNRNLRLGANHNHSIVNKSSIHLETMED